MRSFSQWGSKGPGTLWPSLNLAVSMLRPERPTRLEALFSMGPFSALHPFPRKAGLGRRPESSKKRVYLGDTGRHGERTTLTAVRIPRLKPQATIAATVLLFSGLQPGSIWKSQSGQPLRPPDLARIYKPLALFVSRPLGKADIHFSSTQRPTSPQFIFLEIMVFFWLAFL